MSDICDRIGKNIRQIRKIRGMTMQDVADALQVQFGMQVSQSIVGAWQRGERRISADNLFCIASVLECSVHTLFGIISDVRVEAGILSQHEQQIITFLFNEWDGDTHALIELVGMYMAASKDARGEMVVACLNAFRNDRNLGRVSKVPYEINTSTINRKLRLLVK